MIKGIYETHIHVADLERSIDFYSNKLTLKLAARNNERRVAFFWVGENKKTMLGVWEKPASQIAVSHFAFESTVDFVLNRAVPFLKERDLKPYNFNKTGDEPLVFTWMPAIAIYFDDPDGHVLEYIALLDGETKVDDLVSFQEWEKLKRRIEKKG